MNHDDKAIQILQSDNVALATGIAKVCNNVMDKMVEFSEDIQNEKQAKNIIDVTASVQAIAGLEIPKQLDVNVTNQYVNGFDFIEITADDVIEIEPIENFEHEFRRTEEIDDEESH